jgi:hypothetical protein
MGSGHSAKLVNSVTNLRREATGGRLITDLGVIPKPALLIELGKPRPLSMAQRNPAVGRQGFHFGLVELV